MLFNSFEFLFAFLPISVAGYYWVSRHSQRMALAWLVLMSFVFYGWWNALFITLLAISVLSNYSFGLLLQKYYSNARAQTWILTFAIIANLAVLFYYKYFAFALGLLGKVGLRLNLDTTDIILPLGISFFTFTQIGYLIDCKAGIAKGRNFLDYALFVTFFPHLIAGPILHHREMIPQFQSPEVGKFRMENLAVGLALFIVGLAKKVVIADHLAPMGALGFENGNSLGLVPMWVAVLAYSLQLYFDFSGYSDMAAGQAKMFGIKFPANFNSPYKATSIIAFWERFHMTLTRYLTLYLYNPISLWVTRRRAAAGRPIGRQGASTIRGFLVLVAFPTFVTILLAGVWHGAGATFAVFGLLHGIYLTTNHAWRIFGPRQATLGLPSWVYVALSGILTYLCVVVGQVFFRAGSIGNALGILSGMVGARGYGYGAYPKADAHGLQQIADTLLSPTAALVLSGCYLLIILAPNSLELFSKYDPVIGRVRTSAADWLLWRPEPAWGTFVGLLAALSLLYLAGATEFLYFQF